MIIFPTDGVKNPANTSINVDFPAPLSPITPIEPFPFQVKSIPSNIAFSDSSFFTFTSCNFKLLEEFHIRSTLDSFFPISFVAVISLLFAPLQVVHLT